MDDTNLTEHYQRQALKWIRQYCVITKDENIDKKLIIAKCKEVLGS